MVSKLISVIKVKVSFSISVASIVLSMGIRFPKSAVLGGPRTEIEIFHNRKAITEAPTPIYNIASRMVLVHLISNILTGS